MKITNYKTFRTLELHFNNKRNILIGENGSGKTSILEAISYVLGARIYDIESKGLQTLFNVEVIEEFLIGEKRYEDLPKLEIEVFIADNTNHKVTGIHNSENNNTLSGLRMTIEPNQEYSEEIKTTLQNSDIFPFDYYIIAFKTFDGRSYTSYNQFLRYALIDSTKISSIHASQNYVANFYNDSKIEEERVRLQHLFREQSDSFSRNNLMTEQDGSYQLKLNYHRGKALEENLTLQKDNVDITNFGRGDSMFLNINFALSRTRENTRVILIEEPENHLSYLNMHKLIDKVDDTEEKQIFVATHSNMIATKLNLKNAIFVGNGRNTYLNNLDDDTSRFFQKSPDNSALNFILAKKIILVEGNAEYILLDSFYKKIREAEMYEEGIAMISVGGLAFKRYLEIAQELDKKVAIITDNDGNYRENIEEKYQNYISDNIKIFAPREANIYTFEVSIHGENETFLEEHLRNNHMSNGILPYMLKNKAEAAFRILTILEENDNYDSFAIPEYISEAFEWIN